MAHYIASNISVGSSTSKTTVITEGSGDVTTHIETNVNGEKKVLDAKGSGTYTLENSSNNNTTTTDTPTAAAAKDKDAETNDDTLSAALWAPKVSPTPAHAPAGKSEHKVIKASFFQHLANFFKHLFHR